jgi:hypothetical protein
MTQDEIIEMAKLAGFEMDNSCVISPQNLWYIYQEQLEAFAKLVAAKERSNLAQEVEDIRSDECDFKKFEDTHNDGWLDACNAVLDTIYGWGRDFESKE